jgi:hypothetical protein
VATFVFDMAFRIRGWRETKRKEVYMGGKKDVKAMPTV